MKTSISTFFFIWILIISCTSQSDKNSRTFTLKGEIADQDTGTIILRYVPDATLILDTAKISKGKFVFKGRITEPASATLIGGNDLNTVEVYLEPSKMKIELSRDNYKECKMTGSKTQDEFVRLKKMQEPINEKLNLLREQRSRLDENINSSKTDSAKQRFKKKIEETDSLWLMTREEFNIVQLEFIRKNPNSFVSPSCLRPLGANEVIALDTLIAIYNKLDKKTRNSKYGKIIKDDIRRKENIRIGALAPEFKALDLNQQTITLSKFKGRNVILLDFWASWCKPCREEIPYLKELYIKYQSKGFEIIAISLDMNKNAWISAVAQDSTDIWVHIPVAQNFAGGPNQLTNDDIYKNYFIQAIPVWILIDKEGIIAGRWGGGLKEPEVTLEEKLAELFN